MKMSKASIALILPLLATPALAISVEEFLQRTANIQTFDERMLHSNVTIIQYLGANHVSMGKQQYAQQLKQMKNAGAKSELSDFRILGKHEAGDFVSVVYSFKSTIKMGGNVMTSQQTSHDVLQKSGSGFLLLFSVAK